MTAGAATPREKGVSVPCCVCGETAERLWRLAPDNLLGGDRLFRDVRCVRCGMVRLNPRPAPEEMGNYYRADTYARAEGEAETGGLARRLNEYNRRLAGRADAAVQRNAGSASPGTTRRALDVGCGDGRFLTALKARGGWEVEGLETDSVAAALARRRIQSTVYEDELEALPLPDGSYDLISLLHVIEHVPDPQATLRTARRLLRPGGTLYLALPNVACLESALFGSSWYPLDLPRHYWGFSPPTLRRLAADCGFTVTGVRHFPFLFTFQSIRYVVRALRGRKAVAPVAPPESAPTPPSEGGALRTRLFLGLLSFSEAMGHIMPGEVMELEARRVD